MKELTLLILGLLITGDLAFANENEHQQTTEYNHSIFKGDSDEIFSKTETVDGYDIIFRIIKTSPKVDSIGNHHIMIKILKNQHIAHLKAINSKVNHPNSKSESKMMMKMGGWYMASYDLTHTGQHKIMLLFKTIDGQKHFISTVYEQKIQ